MSVMNTYKKTSKPSTKKSNVASSESAQERALNLFAEMMILCWRQHKIINVVHLFMSVSFIFTYVLGSY